MPDYDNNMKGVLFRNDKKESEKHPDYKGSCEINGVEYWQSAWIKTSKAGAKYMSQTFEEKNAPAPAPAPAQQQTTAAPPATAAQSSGGLADDDDIPF